MLAESHPQMVYYGTGETPSEEDQDQNSMPYEQHDPPHEDTRSDAEASNSHQSAHYSDTAQQPATEESLEDSQRTEAAPPDSQADSGSNNFTVMNPALVEEASANGRQTFVTTAGGTTTYHNISTLPFVQNGSFPVQTSYTNSVNGELSAPSEGFVEGVSSGQELNSGMKVETDNSIAEDEDLDEDDESLSINGEEIEGEGGEFACQICSDSFADQASLDEHIANHPPPKEFICETCNKGFATRRYLKYHRKNHCKRAGSYEGGGLNGEDNDSNGEIIKRFTCNICSRPFRVLKCMKVHKKKKHGILKDFTCNMCAVTFGSSQELVSHSCASKVVKIEPPTVLPSQTPQHLQVQSHQGHVHIQQVRVMFPPLIDNIIW